MLKGGLYPRSCPSCGLGRYSCKRHQELSDDTLRMVDDFAYALKSKLVRAQQNKGKSGWEEDSWMEECQRELIKHVYKGDPLDVAAYAAFCWYHGWSTWPDDV